MRAGLFGGTFDPPHEGHTALARAAVTELKLDRLFIVPAGDPPLKPLPPATPARRRLALARVAFAGIPRATVSPWEVRRRGVSYTHKTLTAFMRRFPAAEWYLVIGGDSLRGFTRWRRWESILRRATLAVGRRAGVSSRGVPASVKSRVIFLKARLPRISSTELRSREVKKK